MPEYNEPQITEDQIKMALAAAKGAHRQDSTLRHVGHAERAEIRDNQHAAQNLLLSSLIKAGFELDKFDELRAQNRSALRRLVEKQKAEAVTNSSSVNDALLHEAESRRKTVEHLATHGSTDLPVDAAPPTRFAVDQPSWTMADPGIVFEGEQFEPWRSYAKFSFGTSEDTVDGDMDFHFYFFWQNPRDVYTLTNVDTWIALNGYCNIGSDGGILPSKKHSHLWVTGGLFPYSLTPPPIGPTLPQPEQTYDAVILKTDTGGFMNQVGAVDGEQVHRGFGLSKTSFLVPPNGVVQFEVNVMINFDIDDGLINVDFSSGDYSVMCPAVVINIVG